MERVPEMTSKVTTLVRGTRIEDPGPVPGDHAGMERPDPEVPQRGKRRTFTAQYKLEILAAYDAAAEGEKEALLRRRTCIQPHCGHFASIETVRQHCQLFFPWYDEQHRHSGLGLHPPNVHYGTAAAIHQQRGTVLTAAYHDHPE